jgi:phosphoribosylamine--glycine ligase
MKLLAKTSFGAFPHFLEPLRKAEEARMRVLVVGSGGREHAICWSIAGSPLLTKLWCAPGNPGIANVAECVPIQPMDIPALVAFAQTNKIDLVFPGPEAPLVAGIVDAMVAGGIKCCGPTAAAAQLEGSKTFTKEVADAAGIPTARWERFDDAEAARAFVHRRGAPVVVKADGLAAGKGVVVAKTESEAIAAIDALMGDRIYGESEVSFFALCDGETAISLGSAQDHKRVGAGDIGPNTGGMGSYSPVPDFPPALEGWAMETVIRPTLAEMVKRGAPFRGILYAGLMLTEQGPKLIEFNVRFGDPECQVLLGRMRSDLLPALMAACDGELSYFDVRWRDVASIAVVMAARGYPEAPESGSAIAALDKAEATGATVFHAGTTRDSAGVLRAAGGRVLTMCATGETLQQARDTAYAAVDALDWPEGFCRRDIAWRALITSR